MLGWPCAARQRSAPKQPSMARLYPALRPRADGPRLTIGPCSTNGEHTLVKDLPVDHPVEPSHARLAVRSTATIGAEAAEHGSALPGRAQHGNDRRRSSRAWLGSTRRCAARLRSTPKQPSMARLYPALRGTAAIDAKAAEHGSALPGRAQHGNDRCQSSRVWLGSTGPYDQGRTVGHRPSDYARSHGFVWEGCHALRGNVPTFH